MRSSILRCSGPPTSVATRMSISSFFPSPEEVELLPLDQLALLLLRHIQAQEADGGKAQVLNVINNGAWPQIDHVARFRLLCHLQEAWDWLYVHGLITNREPSQTHGIGFTFITRLGQRVLDDPHGLERTRAQARLDVEIHPAIRDRIRSQFLLGDYELAAIAAHKEVEVRVRKLGHLPNSLVGKQLVTAAFREGGPLRDPSMESGESDALLALFVGAVGVFRNPVSHREVRYEDATEASEVILVADLLLRILDRVESRLRAGEDD